jgi:hypothetical protein
MTSNDCNPTQFAELLSQAIRRIALERKCTLAKIQREVGQAIGRRGQHTVDYWQRGHIPAKTADVECLARELVRRNGFQSPDELRQFLECAQFPESYTLCREIFASFPPLWPERPTFSGDCPFKTAPFQNGRPILRPHQFFGRGSALEHTFQQLGHLPLPHIAIIGPRSSGKTSFLHYLKSISTTSPAELRPGQKQDWLPQPDAYRWVYIDFQSVLMQNQETLLQTILVGLGFDVPHPCRLADFMRIMAHGPTAPSIILLDEIEQAIEADGLQQAQLWTSLRALACDAASERLGFIVACKQTPHQLAVHAQNGLATFLGIFGHTVELGAFTESEARQLIASSPCPFPSDDVTWILEQSQNWPVLLQVMCLARWNASELAGENWQAAALRQSAPYRFLLDLPVE